MKINLMVAIIVFLWIGMILAIGMESIVKFQTPTLTKLVAFDVGRTVFNAFNKVQLFLLALVILGVCFGRVSKVEMALTSGLAVTLLLQIFWLFPELNQRVDMLFNGVTPPASYKHALYGMLEVVKLVLLVVAGFMLLPVGVFSK